MSDTDRKTDSPRTAEPSLSVRIAGIVEAQIRAGDLPAQEVPGYISRIARALGGLEQAAASAPRDAGGDDPSDWMPTGTFGPQRPPWDPAVPIEDSYDDQHIVCLEDGRRLQLLKRHLKGVYGMTPEQYRAKWKLPDDYPMAARNYCEERRKVAKDLGFQSRGAEAR